MEAPLDQYYNITSGSYILNRTPQVGQAHFGIQAQMCSWCNPREHHQHSPGRSLACSVLPLG